GDYIGGVRLGSIDNTDNDAIPDPGYIAYAFSTDLMAGVEDTIYITSGEYDGDAFGAWIDLNNDQDFDDDNEHIATIASVQGHTESARNFTIPVGTAPGHKRLRVRCWDVGQNDPCTPTDYGQTQDYDVNITVNTGVATTAANELRLLPTTDGVQLISDASLIGNSYLLLDAMGRTLSTGRITSERTALPMLPFAHGAYTVQVLSGDARQVKRFVW
ncbi:MAG: GEVED domain-containing protein, partial [Flavobacteriales bacterium]